MIKCNSRNKWAIQTSFNDIMYMNLKKNTFSFF